MNNWIFQIVLSGKRDNNILFRDLQTLLHQLQFIERQSKKGSSHYIYYRDDIPEIINIQPRGNKAKGYQVKQVRKIILKYGIAFGGESNV